MEDSILDKGYSEDETSTKLPPEAHKSVRLQYSTTTFVDNDNDYEPLENQFVCRKQSVNQATNG